ncbi:trichothecene efflux pump [Fusarium austroafricanum]|uniref:Trichothecene efflux pump n=1 Tax=Fusarium austroafricanum TaxID=2364996 RepID=A0A8H4KAA1_9HYPO|nr:trichothecene efflux pump [Fusarium austroafricanum]
MHPDTPKTSDNGASAEEVEKAVAQLHSDQDTDGSDFKMTWQKWLAMASFQLGYMSDVFVLSMASSILQEINRDIGPDANFAWMATAQILGAAVISPTIGRLSDIFGRRNFLIIGNIIGAIGCAVAATAQKVNTVIGASAVIGMGSAMHQLAWSCLAELVPKKSRFFALGVFQSTLAPSSAFAPVIAYSMIKAGSWRGAYWLPFGLDLAGLVLVFFFYKPVNQYILVQGKTRWQQFLGLDWVGNFLLVAGLVLLLVGISLGGNRYPWASGAPITMIIVGALLLVALGFWERFARLEAPIFPREIFANIRGFTVILAGVFLLGMLYYSTAVLWPQQVAMLYTQDIISIGWYSSTTGAAGSIIGPIGGYLFTKIGHARWVLTGTILALATVSGAQAVVTPGSYVASTILTALIGGLVACATIASTSMIQLGVPHHFIGIATGLAITCRSVGGSIGTTIYSTVLSSRFRSYLASKAAKPLAMAGVDPKAIGGILTALLSGNPNDPALEGVSPDILAIAGKGIKSAFASALRAVYLISIAFGAVAVICVAFSKDVDHLMTKEVNIRLAADQSPKDNSVKRAPPSEPHAAQAQ